MVWTVLQCLRGLALLHLLVLVMLSNADSLAAPEISREPSSVIQKTKGHVLQGRRKTSIVLMMADDLGYGDIEFLRHDLADLTGSDSPLSATGAKTPHFNELSRSSHTVRFLNFHSASAVCSPTRASALSGRHPERDCILGANADHDRPGMEYQDTWPFHPKMPSVARDAQIAGYVTGFVGKWHLGAMKWRSPGQMGFDYWKASTGNIPTYDPDCLDNEAMCQATCDLNKGCFVVGKGRKRKARRQCSSNYTASNCDVGHYETPWNFSPGWSSDMFTATRDKNNGNWSEVREIKVPRFAMSSEYLVDEFKHFVENVVPANQAFMVFLWFHEPHHPFISSPGLFKSCQEGVSCHFKDPKDSSNRKLVDYLGTIVALDRAVGRVRTILRNLNRDDDTLLVVTSDNGPQAHERDGAGSASLLRGWKGGVYEGGHRVVGLIEFPLAVKHNRIITNSVASSLDLSQTFRDLFVLENPELNLTQMDEKRDGVSLLPLLFGNVTNSDQGILPNNWTRPVPFGLCYPIQFPSKTFCDRFAFIDGSLKLIAKRRNRPSDYLRSLNRGDSSKLEVYDLSKDVQEKFNLVTRGLNSQDRARIETLVKKATAWITELSSAFQSNCGGMNARGAQMRQKWSRKVPNVTIPIS